MDIQTLVIGATSAGIAYALSHPGCVIAEKGMNLLTDYTDCMNIRPVDTAALADFSPMVRALFAEAEAKNLVGAPDETHLAALHPFPLIGLAAARLLEAKVPVLSFCRVQRIQAATGGFDVRLLCMDSHMTAHCGAVIDATAYGDPAFAEACGAVPAPSVGRAIAASMRAAGGVSSCGFDLPDGARMIKGRFDDEYYLELPLADTATYRDGFTALHDLWQKLAAGGGMAGFEYIDTAGELIYRTESFFFTENSPDAYRLIPATARDVFFNLDAAYKAVRR